jgi:hypothetical protein
MDYGAHFISVRFERLDLISPRELGALRTLWCRDVINSTSITFLGKLYSQKGSATLQFTPVEFSMHSPARST